MALDGSYGGLQASIADFLNRGDLTAVIPDFIALAEAQMARRLVSRAGAIEGVGAEQTQQQQAEDSAAYQEFLRQAQFPIEEQQLRSQALTEIPIQQSSTSTTSNSPGLLDFFKGGSSSPAVGAADTAVKLAALFP